MLSAVSACTLLADDAPVLTVWGEFEMFTIEHLPLFYLGAIVQHDIQKRAVNLQIAIVADEAELSELVQ